MIHQPVLLKETIELLDPKPNENFIDATFGDGGHSLEILKRAAPNGKVLGIDWDREAIENFDGRGLDSRSIFKYVSEPLFASEEKPRQNRSGVELPPVISGDLKDKRLFLFSGNFADIRDIASLANFSDASGILFDLGFRTFHTEESDRGFSFQKNQPLNMRYDSDPNGLTAEKIVNEWSEKDLEKIFREYGEERNSKRIARAIEENRKKKKIKTSGELVEVINGTYMTHGTNRPSVKTLARIFQALRIAVNGELENIKAGLNRAWDIVIPGGRIAVISFHSLEDRIAKNFFKEKKISGEGEILTKKPIMASEQEMSFNPRSRSAKLRAIRKLGFRR